MKDPFHERSSPFLKRRLPLLGGLFEFQGTSVRLMRLVEAAYGRLPLPPVRKGRPLFQLTLALQADGEPLPAREPPQIRTRAGAGIICASADAANFIALHPETRRGLVAISRDMLRFPYHARYELLEFAVFTLASRAQGLVPLHGACVGSESGALLLVGESGAGKSTLTLQCMQQGLELLAEDAVFVDPHSLLAFGVPNFLHLRRDSLRFIEDAAMVSHIRRSPVIQRRSGVRKFEVDVRHHHFPIARRPMKLAGVVFVSGKGAKGKALLTPLDRTGAMASLRSSQAYAAGLESWAAFVKSLVDVPLFKLHRAAHPREAASALVRLLGWGKRHR